MTERKPRSRNHPKKYKQNYTPITEAKARCSECEKNGLQTYIRNPSIKVWIDGKQIRKMPLTFCPICRNVIFNEEVMELIKD